MLITGIRVGFSNLYSEMWCYFDNGVSGHGTRYFHRFEYGPQFRNGDIIGCCVDFEKEIVFCTKNGQYLDVDLMTGIFDETNGDVYVNIWAGEYQNVYVNFGKQQFYFDIMTYMRQR